jgi:hypothetical protein
MTMSMTRELLLYCAIINYAIVFIWFVAFTLAHDWIYRLHGRWFRLSLEGFDTVHYGGMALYKVGIVLLTVVPYLALSILD